MDSFPFVDNPPAFSIRKANGAVSYKYLSLAGCFYVPNEVNIPSPLIKI